MELSNEMKWTWMSSGMKLLRLLAMSRTVLKAEEVINRDVYAENAPAGTTPPADGWPVGRETCPLSFRMTTTRELMYAALFIASYAMPPEVTNETQRIICTIEKNRYICMHRRKVY